MAILLAKSRTIISNILKITTNVSPFENILKQRCTKNHSWFHANLASYKTLAGDLVSGRPRGLLASSAAALTFRRPESARAGELAEAVAYTDEDEDEDEDEDDDANQGMDFPGGRVTFTPQMEFISESSEKRVPCYRVLDDDGYTITGSIFEQVDEEKAVKMYKSMVTLQIMDTIFYEAQRQGRLSFYLTSSGEEAINIATAAALTPDDIILPQYREPGILLWRGFTIQQFANQLFGTKDGNDKGRQMPVHYGSKQLNYFTISSPIATQLPQAAGVAYSLKMDNKEACVVAFMGDGCTSEAYGIRSLRVDGNDTLAVYSAISAAREMVIREQKPMLVEVKLGSPLDIGRFDQIPIVERDQALENSSKPDRQIPKMGSEKRMVDGRGRNRASFKYKETGPGRNDNLHCLNTS
ncbi:2-oxoisovalerate dehydrogenase subunit alpha 1 mitochondrial [Phtheirospermum japonicum]|uniref:2-oxoisovalerate dehydrogenase subunit alpha 1 mitochondrial n=1 Tax=Phtheirospermum japonicum TaxID=374723 RepID=A0A830DP60_9LAMI|nr:2-oxoisovalerate dehydrogenase subunit alpha 1 mitochondrial [Phtheirospermum japonicum]